MANIYEPEFDGDRDDPTGFKARRAYLGRQAGAERIGASLWELQPGDAPYPYHFHLGSEEFLIVLKGRPHLRTQSGWRQMEEGECAAFPVGEGGAHQVHNRTDETVRMLSISEMNAPEVVVQPDSGKVGARERAAGPDASGLWHTSFLADGVKHFEGESVPEV